MLSQALSTAVLHKLQHLDFNTLGIVWARTPSNYERISEVLAAMETINPDGTAACTNSRKITNHESAPLRVPNHHIRLILLLRANSWDWAGRPYRRLSRQHRQNRPPNYCCARQRATPVRVVT